MLSIDETLVDLDFNSLFRLAEWHEKQATVARARAHRLEQRKATDMHIDREIKYLQTLPQYVMKYLRQGHDLDGAIKLAADHTDCPPLTVRARWKKFISIKNSADMAQRNRLIKDLAEFGLTNEQIGKRVALHKNSVSRLLSKTNVKRNRHILDVRTLDRLCPPKRSNHTRQKESAPEGA